MKVTVIAGQRIVETATNEMLTILAITAALQLAPVAGDFLDECPIDRYLRVENELVMDVLRTFAKDLAFVQAGTQIREARNYSDLRHEMHDGEPLPPDMIEVRRFFDDAVDLLGQDRVDQAKSLLMDRNRPAYVQTEGTYWPYLQAEVERLLGNNTGAASAIVSLFLARTAATGVSINQLERLDGLVALQKVSVFNQDVNKLHGLARDVDADLLTLVRMVTRGELKPLKHLRAAVSGGMLREPRLPLTGFPVPITSVGPPRPTDSRRRVGPALDDFTGQSVSYGQVEAILCEFAQVLFILDISTLNEDAPEDDYGAVIAQVRQMDATLADTLQEDVVPYIHADPEGARQRRIRFWRRRDETQPRPDDYLGSTEWVFREYFRLEHIRRTDGRCDARSLQSLQDGVKDIRDIRELVSGLSLDKIIELEAKVVLLWMKCFHARVRAAYELDGTEDEQRLAEKRARLGTCRRLPDDSIIEERVKPW